MLASDALIVHRDLVIHRVRILDECLCHASVEFRLVHTEFLGNLPIVALHCIHRRVKLDQPFLSSNAHVPAILLRLMPCVRAALDAALVLHAFYPLHRSLLVKLRGVFLVLLHEAHLLHLPLRLFLLQRIRLVPLKVADLAFSAVRPAVAVRATLHGRHFTLRPAVCFSAVRILPIVIRRHVHRPAVARFHALRLLHTVLICVVPHVLALHVASAAVPAPAHLRHVAHVAAAVASALSLCHCQHTHATRHLSHYAPPPAAAGAVPSMPVSA